MNFWIKLTVFTLVVHSCVGSIPENLWDNAAEVAHNDGIGAGFCGRGVWNILRVLGYSSIQSGNGQDWERILYNNGWRSIKCLTPQQAPLGSVLVYISDVRRYGHNIVGTKGGTYGHVEIVAREYGQKVYVSDAARFRPGGTVASNFTGRAWLPPNVVDKPQNIIDTQSIQLRDIDDATHKNRTSFQTKLFLRDLPKRQTNLEYQLYLRRPVYVTQSFKLKIEQPLRCLWPMQLKDLPYAKPLVLLASNKLIPLTF